MILITVRNAVHLVILATLLHFCQGKSLGNEISTVNSTESRLWRPKVGTMSDWLKCRGMPKDACQRTMNKYQRLKEMLVQEYDVDDVDNNGDGSDPGTEPESSSFGQCVWLTEQQIDTLMTDARIVESANVVPHRSKRTLTNFKTYPLNKWSMPVHYKFDGTHDEMQKSTIRNAFQHWMDNTCIRFKEIETDAEFNDNHILVTSQGYGCHSYVGRTSVIPQPINLHEDCFEAFGTPVHEIGHSLGLWHEQMRLDRDVSIRIISENIYEGFLSEFAVVDSDSLGLSYNYGSVMHYSSKGGASTNGKDTMIALEPLYQMNMGQRTGLSFHDARIMNSAYCQGSCATPLRQPCQRSGYQNPNNCSTCVCPDGFSGQYCEHVAPAKHATCGGVLNLAPETFEIIKSPNYDTLGYTAHQECNWLIKVPKNYAVLLTFDGDFGIYCESASCFHWVEVKYKKDLGLEGGRFCCYSMPSDTIVSESNEMMVTFRSNYTINTRLRGFQAVVEPIFVNTENNPDPPIVRSTESATTTTTATSTSTPRTPTISPVSTPDYERPNVTSIADSSNSIRPDNLKMIITIVSSIVAYLLSNHQLSN